MGQVAYRHHFAPEGNFALMVLDRIVGERMNHVFLADLQHAEEITAAAFRERSWLQRLAERGANMITRLL